MTPQPQQQEYIITGEYIKKLDEWLDEHGINELQRMQIRTRLKLTPRVNEENHCDKCDHWDMCEGCPYTDERSRPVPTTAPVRKGPCKNCTDPNQCYTPCIGNGCTDIENCDEICENQRIYSPAWVKEHEARIRADAATLAENKRVLDRIKRIIENEQIFNRYRQHTDTNASISYGWQAREYQCEELLKKFESLRQPKEREQE
jgi:hypothetical protein